MIAGMEAQRSVMVADQLRARGITAERVLAAMAEVPREEFVPVELQRHAYEDHPLAIGGGQTISQPFIVASMTQALELDPGDVALEVGAGSGYQAAILARLCRRVLTIERDPDLAATAAANLARLGIENVEVRTGDGSLGAIDLAPYSAILVAAAARRVPPALLEQLAVGGRMVIPVESAAPDQQDLVLITREASKYSSRVLFPVRFVPLVEG